LAVAGCGQSPSFTSTCTGTAPPEEASKPAMQPGDGTAILPGGRLITPAGRLLDVGGFPIALKILPGDRYAVVTDDAEDAQALRLVDLKAADPLHPVVSQQAYTASNNRHDDGLFYGLALTADGKRLYVSNGGYDPVPDSQMGGHYNTVEVFDIAGDPPLLTRNDALALKLMFSAGVERVPSGIALSADGMLLYVANQFDNSLSILSLQTGANYGAEIGRAVLPGIGAYDVAVDEASHTAFVSLWGGDSTKASVVDGVVPVDVTDPTQPTAAAEPIATGKAAEAELLLAGKLYVANADADTLSIVDAASRTVKTIPATTSMILGATPNNLAIEPPGATGNGRIYLANAGENAVVAIDLATMAILGRIPTAWYPTAVGVLADGSVVIASARGLGRGPNDVSTEPPYSSGTLQVVPRPSDDDLKAMDAVVATNLERPHTLEAKPSCPSSGEARFPLQVTAGAKSPIEHVFLFVRENKTYDDLFGDLPGGNGKPSLVSYGEDNTPNAHALARSFVLLDNFYSHAELSVQGHEWTTSCIANDYTEKSWQHSDDYGRGYLPPVPWGPPSTLSRLATPGSGSIWAHLDKAGVPYHNYGEVVNNADAQTPPDPGFPGVFFNTHIPDVDKVAYVLSNVTDPTFKVEPFSYLLIPNDHTNGTSPGAQTPQSLIADNDEATGRFIDGLSHSKLWESSIVFVVEDDPAGNADHVEEHRSICLVASPWIKRGYHSSTNFDLGSVYHTIETLIGVGPMNLNDGHAAGMYELFSEKPDPTPFTFVPRRIPTTLNTADAPLAAESARIDFSRPDRGDLRRILWKATHGRDAEPPGANRKRNRLDTDDDD
jgi:YVTN family beta-propeller protein